MIKFKYNGRTYSSANSLNSAIKRDFERAVDSDIRRAAGSSGLKVRKTPKGYELNGNSENMKRFQRRIGN